MATSALGFQSFYQTQLTSGISDTDLTIPVDTGPTPTEGFLVLEPSVPAKREIIYYTSKTSSSVTVPAGAGNGRGYDGTTPISHAQGATVIMAPVAAMFEELRTLFTTTPQGWTSIATVPTVSTGYNKGNREYDLTFANVDLSSSLSPGMRFKIDRTGTTPTQCTDLEASSSQYWSKTSPSGISFTDDFTCEAWVKLESYTAEGGIVCRRNGDTEGWSMSIQANGTVRIQSLRIAANNRSVDSNQSIPLNRWVHVAATMDNSANTHTIYIDGVSVATTVTTNGTITALVQGTTSLNVGSMRSNGTNPFDGEISDVRVWSAVRTATQIRDNMNQQLVGNESNLVAYFKLNGNANDLTSNANNLSAVNSATATTVDHPFRDTEYAIITKVAYSAPNTTVTVFTGTDHNIPNMTLANPYYSTQSSPFGFPRDRGKWKVETVGIASLSTQATSYTNLNNTLSVPTGAWKIYFSFPQVALRLDGASTRIARITISTSTSAETDGRLTWVEINSTSSSGAVAMSAYRESYTNLATQTPYYLLGMVGDAVHILQLNADTDTGIRSIGAECAYL